MEIKGKRILPNEEIDILKISALKDQLDPTHNLCQMIIVCSAPDYRTARALKKYLLISENTAFASCSKNDGVWSVRILRALHYKHIQNELAFFRLAIQRFSCIVVDWDLTVAELG